MKLILRLLVSLALPASGLADPQLASWYTLHAGQYARIYRSDAARLAGESVTTWGNGRLSQAQPVQSGIREILYSDDWIYVRSTGLASQIMGPWYMDASHYRVFPNLPTDQGLILRLPRHPEAQTSPRFQPLGEIGLTVDGVRIFDASDAFSYTHASGYDAGPRAGLGQGDRVWERNAFVNEAMTFDPGMGHQQNWGRYHYHAEDIALRYELGDHVDFNAVTKTYRESTNPVVKHSPIIGWLQDGYPLYGPYGYADPNNPAGGVRRMISGYVPRDGQNGADDLAQTGRRTLPAWTARAWKCSTGLPEEETGPNVTEYFPIGHYLEDYAYRGDLGQVQGRDFDLDESNGRWCVTPEFPQGTYAYFTTVDERGKPVYPYAMGKLYHGQATGRLVRAIEEPVATYFTSPAATEATTDAPTPLKPVVTLVWSPNNGGGYQPSAGQ